MADELTKYDPNRDPLDGLPCFTALDGVKWYALADIWPILGYADESGLRKSITRAGLVEGVEALTLRGADASAAAADLARQRDATDSGAVASASRTSQLTLLSASGVLTAAALVDTEAGKAYRVAFARGALAARRATPPPQIDAATVEAMIVLPRQKDRLAFWARYRGVAVSPSPGAISAPPQIEAPKPEPPKPHPLAARVGAVVANRSRVVPLHIAVELTGLVPTPTELRIIKGALVSLGWAQTREKHTRGGSSFWAKPTQAEQQPKPLTSLEERVAAFLNTQGRTTVPSVLDALGLPADLGTQRRIREAMTRAKWSPSRSRENAVTNTGARVWEPAE